MSPRQNGLPVDFDVVPWYLAGLFGAAVLAWLLSWAKTYVLARVSEQISADLRNETYAHLQRLSLEFFGGKRTGDLISRVGSDTDRICTFLSVNLLDFGTDVLMIVMTAVILFSIDPTMALVTLLPFPFIAWMAQKVRIRLAPWLRSHARRLGGNGQRAGRHDSRHPRREGVCPGEARDRALRPSQSARVRCQQSRQRALVVFRPDRHAAHRFRHAGDLGLWRLARVQPTGIHRRHAGRRSLPT